MKDILKHFAIGLVIGLIISGLMLWSYNVGKKHSTNTVETITDTIQINDTITQWQPYDVHHYRTDTAYLPVIDTLLDTVTDTVLVEVPISIYSYDTTITDSTYRTVLRAVVSGFQTSVDSVYLSTEIIKQEPKIAPKKWYQHLCPAVGIGFGTGGQIGVFGGIGYEL